MPVNLVKGQDHVLNMNVFHVGLGWYVNEDASQFDFDLDVAAFMVGSNKNILTDDYLVFYNSKDPYRVDPNNLTIAQHPDSNKYSSEMEWREKTRPVSPDWSVIGSIDDNKAAYDGDDKIMDINLSKISPDVQEIIITVSIYDNQNRKQNFGQVKRAYVRLYKSGNDAEGREDYRYDLTEDFSTCASVEFCRLYRRNGEWEVQALGIGHKGGLEELVSKFT